MITAPVGKGYESDFLHYSQSDLYAIVKEIKDYSLPPIPSDLVDCDIVIDVLIDDL